MASEAVASSSSTGTTNSPASISSCWNPYSVQAAYDMAVYNLTGFYGLGLFYDPNFPHIAASYHSSEAANAASRPKRRKIEGSNPVQEQQQQCATTRLSYDPRNRGRVGWKPYSDIHGVNGSLASGGRLARKGEDLRPNGLKTLKRKHGESLSHVNSNVVKNTQVLQPDRGCTIGNLFPEILSMIFEYCDVQSKGRAAQVRSDFFLLFLDSFRKTFFFSFLYSPFEKSYNHKFNICMLFCLHYYRCSMCSQSKLISKVFRSHILHSNNFFPA